MHALRVAFLALFALSAFGQPKLSVSQLKSFLRSSLELKHPDKQVADYLKKVVLTERLDDRTIEELQGEGIGPKTVESLRALRDATAIMPKAAAEAPKPAAPPPIPPPSPEDQKRIIEEARELALGYAKRLPDFICLQVTRRYVDPSGLEFFQLADTVAARLSYFEQKEDYKVVSINGNLSNIEYEKLGGASSSGEFGTMLRQVFEPGTRAEFRWERWATLRGRRAHVYAYRVLQPFSQWHITYERTLDIIPGYKGFVFIDKDVPTVLRLTLEAVDIPVTFPVQEAKSMLDYDYTSISEKEFLLPLRAEVRMREGKFLVKNQVEFRNYRKFGADASITFDLPDPLSEDKTKEKPPQP